MEYTYIYIHAYKHTCVCRYVYVDTGRERERERERERVYGPRNSNPVYRYLGLNHGKPSKPVQVPYEVRSKRWSDDLGFQPSSCSGTRSLGAPSSPKQVLLRLLMMIETQQDVRYQRPRNPGAIVRMRSCRICLPSIELCALGPRVDIMCSCTWSLRFEGQAQVQVSLGALFSYHVEPTGYKGVHGAICTQPKPGRGRGPMKV